MEDFATGAINRRQLEHVQRFNDTYHNEAVVARVGVAEQAAARRAKAAERKAQSEGTAERSESPRCGSVAVASRLAAGSGQPSGAEAPDARCESCGVTSRLAAGSAEAELPATYFTPAMVKSLRRHPSSI